MVNRVSVIGQYVYPEALEKLLLRGFKSLDGVEVVPRPDKGADLSLCVKLTEPPADAGGVSALFMTDNVERFPKAIEYAENFDQVFAIHGDIPGAYQINCGYDPEIHWSIDNCEKQGRAVFVGTAHPCRKWMAEVDGLELYGNDWGKYGVDTNPVYKESKRFIYGCSKMSVNQTYPGDLANMRFYEALRMGKSTVFVTDRYPSGEGWEPGKHFLTYDGTRKGLQGVIDDWLGRGDELLEIARQGWRKAERFTYRLRAEEMLEKAGIET